MMLDPCKSVYCFMAYTQNASFDFWKSQAVQVNQTMLKIKYSFIGRTVILNLQQL